MIVANVRETAIFTPYNIYNNAEKRGQLLGEMFHPTHYYKSKFHSACAVYKVLELSFTFMCSGGSKIREIVKFVK